MRRRFLAAAAAAVAAGCLGAAPAARPTTEAEVTRISAEELKKGLDAKGVVVIDTRSQPAYEAGHIRGALLWDESQADKLAVQIQAGRQAVVAYCT